MSSRIFYSIIVNNYFLSLSLKSPYGEVTIKFVLDWIGLDWIALHCIALHCIALHCIRESPFVGETLQHHEAPVGKDLICQGNIAFNAILLDLSPIFVNPNVEFELYQRKSM